MDVERFDGTEVRKEFNNKWAMMLAAAPLLIDPTVKKITLHFPRTIPG